MTKLYENAFALINRQQAEIERLKEALTDHEYGNCVAVENGLIYTHTLEDYDKLIADISAEAVKEFAERLKERKYQSCEWSHGEHPFVIEEDDIDDVLEEMVGEG